MNRLIAVTALGELAFSTSSTAGSPYAGQETRAIKALSQQEVEDYLKGKGLGYAKAAELNQYPGPAHVLEMAAKLTLTKEQTTQTQAIFDVMQTQASALGKQLVEKERELDRQFASGSINATSLKALLSDIGVLQAKIRYVHLNAHLEQKLLLSQQQVQLYDRLRGYGTSSGGGHNHSH